MISSLRIFNIDKPFPLGTFNYVFQVYLITVNSSKISKENIPVTIMHPLNLWGSSLCNKNWATRGDSTYNSELS